MRPFKTLLITFSLTLSATFSFANSKMAVNFCNAEIKNHFHDSVKIQFPEPLIFENDNAYFIHYKDKHKLITGDGANRVDVRCTILKSSYEIILLTIAGIDKLKP